MLSMVDDGDLELSDFVEDRFSTSNFSLRDQSLASLIRHLFGIGGGDKDLAFAPNSLALRHGSGAVR